MALTKAHNRMIKDAPVNVLDFGATAIEANLDNILLEMQTPSTQIGLPW